MNLSNLMPGESRKKISRLLCVTALSTCSVFAYAQQQQVKLTGSNLPLKSVFKQIEKQTDLSIDYRSQDVDDSRIVRQMPKATTVQQAMNQLLAGTDCVVTFSNGHIIIKKHASNTINQQSKLVKGTIVDATGMPVIGANVMVKGTTNGTITDMDGNFSLEAPVGATLVVSYIGLANQEVKAVGNNLTITMKEDAEALDELVVVGYTSQKKGLLAGSVETTKFDESLAQIPVSSPSAVLAGKMAGVKVSTPSGEPGSQPGVSVRTGTTWNTSPMLYVIDGAVLDANAFANLSATEIETVTVLKDAASAAVYGARSDAGVVLVTTKRGKEGKPSINYTANFSADFATQEVELTNLYEAGLLVNQEYKNFGLTAPTGIAWSDEELEWAKNLPNHGYNTMDEVWNTPYVMNHSLSVSGGSEKIKYFAAANYFTQKGFLASTDYDKLNLRMNITADITKDLQLYASISNTNTSTSSAPTEGTGATYGKSRIAFNYMPVYSSDGTKYIGDGWAYGNVAAAANGASGYENKDWMNPIVNISITYKLPWVNGLSLKASYMGSWENTRKKSYRRTEKFYYPVSSGANGHIKNVDDVNLTRYYESSETAGLWGGSEWWTDQQLNFQVNYDRTF